MLAKAKDPRVRGRSRWTAAWTLAFSEDDISTPMNEWMLDVEKWMNPAIVETFCLGDRRLAPNQRDGV